MISHFALGMAFPAFIALLVPPYVNDVTGDVRASGAVMAVISLAALLGPVLGAVADRYRVHRWMLCGGLALMAGGFGSFAVSANTAAFHPVDAVILGLGVAMISAVGPCSSSGRGCRVSSSRGR
jgi:MFS family permease